MKKTLLRILQPFVAIGLLTFLGLRLAKAGKLAMVGDALAKAAEGWPWVVCGMLLFGVCLALCTIRWFLLIRAQGFEVPVSRLAALYLVGHFFNTFLPGATGGDFVKAYYAARESPHRKAEAFTTVFIDRVIGLLGLVVLAITVTCLRLEFFLSIQEMKWALAVNVALLVGAVGGGFLLFRHHLFEEGSRLSRIASCKIGEAVKKGYEALRFCMTHMPLVAATLFISVVNHIVLVLCAFLLGKGLHITVSLADYLAVFPVVNTISAIPITPSGFGTRENAAVFFLAALGVAEPDGLALCLLFDAAILLWGAIGGVVYAFFRPAQDHVAFGKDFSANS